MNQTSPILLAILLIAYVGFWFGAQRAKAEIPSAEAEAAETVAAQR